MEQLPEYSSQAVRHCLSLFAAEVESSGGGSGGKKWSLNAEAVCRWVAERILRSRKVRAPAFFCSSASLPMPSSCSSSR